MAKKSVIIIISTILAVILACFGFLAMIVWLDVDTPPKIPQNSEKGKVILTSRGCCFWAEDVTVYVLDEHGNKTVLISEKKVYEYDVFENKRIPKIDTPIKIGIDFIAQYSDTKSVSLILGEFLSTDEMLENGLLLKFDDATLRVRNGENEKFFSDGGFGGVGDGWYKRE